MLDAGVFEGFEPGAAGAAAHLAGPRSRPGRGAVSEAGAAWARVLSEGVRRDQPARRPAGARAADPGNLGADGCWRRCRRRRGAARRRSSMWRPGSGAGDAVPNRPRGLGLPADASPFDLMAAPPLRHCDVVYLRVAQRGRGGDRRDAALPRRGRGDRGPELRPGRLGAPGRPGEARFAAFRVLTRDRRGRALPQGTERLVLIAARAGPRPLDLRNLAQAVGLSQWRQDDRARGGRVDLRASGRKTDELRKAERNSYSQSKLRRRPAQRS